MNGTIKAVSVVALAVASSTATTTAAATRQRPSCATQSRGAHIVKRSPTARIFLRGTIYYGCLNSARRKVKLLDRVNPFNEVLDTTLLLPRLAGRYAGFADSYFDEDRSEGLGSVAVYDLARGRRVLNAAVGPGESAGHSSVQSLALDARGRAAWGIAYYQGPAAVDEVLSHDRAGLHTLDRRTDAPGLDVASVRMVGDTVTWTRDGVPQSAALAG
jgi:hypothetical protein